MAIANWYNSGSMEAFSRFCSQNKNKRVSLRLMDRSELVIGVLHRTSLVRPVRPPEQRDD